MSLLARPANPLSVGAPASVVQIDADIWPLVGGENGDEIPRVGNALVGVCGLRITLATKEEAG